MRKNTNHKEIVKNVVLSRKHITIIASIKTFNKPTDNQNNFCTNRIIPPFILKAGSMQMRKFATRLPNG